ncbi:unnamed protein product [Coccothraustes coccothraustes]
MVPIAGRLLLRWVPAAPSVARPLASGHRAGLAPHGGSRRCRRARGVTVLQRVLGSPPLEDKSLPLQRPQPHPKPLAPEQCLGFLPTAPQVPSSVGRLLSERGGLSSAASPQERRPQPRCGLCGQPVVGNGGRPPRLLSAAPAAAPEPSGTFRRAGLEPCGTRRSPALTGAAGRGQRRVGVAAVPWERSGARRSRARIALCPGGARNGRPSPESRGRDRAPSVSGQHRACKPQLRKALERS